MSVYWHLYRRRIVVACVAVAATLLALATVAVIGRAQQQQRAGKDASPATRAVQPDQAPTALPTAPASDVRSWDAITPILPGTSAQYPAVSQAARADPSSYAAAFAHELFTRDYARSTRQQLMEWAQHENAPLASPRYPPSDWSKVLVDSLVDLSWDRATDTPIPAEGPWLVLRSERAQQVATSVTTRLDPQWEAAIAHGYQPADRLATVRDVTLTVIQKSTRPGHVTTRRFDVSIALQLGTARDGGYGVATTNNYVATSP